MIMNDQIIHDWLYSQRCIIWSSAIILVIIKIILDCTNIKFKLDEVGEVWSQVSEKMDTSGKINLGPQLLLPEVEIMKTITAVEPKVSFNLLSLIQIKTLIGKIILTLIPAINTLIILRSKWIALRASKSWNYQAIHRWTVSRFRCRSWKSPVGTGRWS